MLITIGLVLVVAGVLFTFVDRLPIKLRRLPGFEFPISRIDPASNKVVQHSPVRAATR